MNANASDTIPINADRVEFRLSELDDVGDILSVCVHKDASAGSDLNTIPESRWLDVPDDILDQLEAHELEGTDTILQEPELDQDAVEFRVEYHRNGARDRIELFDKGDATLHITLPDGTTHEHDICPKLGRDIFLVSADE